MAKASSQEPANIFQGMRELPSWGIIGSQIDKLTGIRFISLLAIGKCGRYYNITCHLNATLQMD
jgi:hypothetical protein